MMSNFLLNAALRGAGLPAAPPVLPPARSSVLTAWDEAVDGAEEAAGPGAEGEPGLVSESRSLALPSSPAPVSPPSPRADRPGSIPTPRPEAYGLTPRRDDLRAPEVE